MPKISVRIVKNRKTTSHEIKKWTKTPSIQEICKQYVQYYSKKKSTEEPQESLRKKRVLKSWEFENKSLKR